MPSRITKASPNALRMTTLTEGTVISDRAWSRVMTRVTARSFSAWALTRKPGVSCSTSSGMPNESHRQTKLIALRQHSGVRPPAIRIGALARTPTGTPPRRPKAVMMLRA